MALLELRPSTSALNVHSKGTATPPWFGDYANKAKWYNDGVPASGNTNGFYNLVTTSSTVVHEFIQYGQNTEGWAGTRFIDETVTITKQTENSDGSIDCEGHMDIGGIASYPTDFLTTPVDVHYKVTANNTVVHDRTGKTGDAYLVDASPNFIAFTAHVAPQTESKVTNLILEWVYPNGEYPNATFVLGVSLYNPNLPVYEPDTVIKSGTSWTINNNESPKRTGRHYDGTKWVETPALPNDKQNQANPDSGFNYYNAFNTWVQSPLPPNYRKVKK